MKNNEFIDVCRKDIIEIYNFIQEYLEDLDIRGLNQSVIYDFDKKIICRSIKNKNKDQIGKEVAIYVYETKEVIRVIKRENSMKLEYSYHRDIPVKYYFKVSLNDSIIKRYFLLSKNSEKEYYKETYVLNNKENLYDYQNSDSIGNIFNDLKQQNKTRKRN